MSLDLRLHPETQALADLLRNVPLDGSIRYSELTDAIGRDVTGPARQRLVSARRIVLREHGAAFETEHGVGLRRIVPDNAANIGSAARKKIRRASNRARRAMTSVAEHSNGLSPEAARRMSAEMSAHGLIGQIATDKAAKAIQAASDKPAAPAKVAETFLNHLRGGRSGQPSESAA